MNKIVLVGCPASGKTTLAHNLSVILDIPILHLDTIFWVEKGGIKQENFIAQQEEWMKDARWIIDGNFMKSKSFDLRLTNADTIIFYDFPKLVIYWRLLKRYFTYFKSGRPEMVGPAKNLLDWSLIRFIWKYPTHEIRAKVLSYADKKKVVMLHNSTEEKLFLEEVKVSV